MFEMKNENDTTATKHKNEHFFQELNKDAYKYLVRYIAISFLDVDLSP